MSKYFCPMPFVNIEARTDGHMSICCQMDELIKGPDGKMYLVTTFIDGEFVANIPPKVTNIQVVEKVIARPVQPDAKEKA
jgi:hypothetical protein